MGGSNLAPTSAKLMEQVRQRVEKVRQENNLPPDATVPRRSGPWHQERPDPHISPASALLQVQRVAKVRGLSESKVRTLVEEHIEPLQFGLFGQERLKCSS